MRLPVFFASVALVGFVLWPGEGAGAAPALDAGPLVLPPAVVGAPYAADLTAAGGTPPHRFRARRRRLPRGIRLTREGRLSGTPRKAGEYRFRVKTKDSGHPRLRSIRTVLLAVQAEAGWRPIAGSDGAPPERWGQASAIDARHSRLLVSGGGSGVNWLSDLHALDLDTGVWTPLTPGGPAPAGRWGHSLVVDEVGNRALLFGGMSVRPHGDVWAFDLAEDGEWTRLEPGGMGPTPRRSHLAVHDPAGRRMIVFGGFDAEHRNDIWALELEGPGAPLWKRIEAAGEPPSPREFATGAFDRARGRLIVIGGAGPTGILDDVHALDLRAAGGPRWLDLTPAVPGPGGRSGALATLQDSHDRILVFGGESAGGLRGDLWSLSLSADGESSWEALRGETADAPTPRTSAAGGLDPVTGRLFVAFGNDGALRNDAHSIAPGPAPPAPRYRWATSEPPGPSPRMNHTLVVDPDHRRAIVFGGFDGAYRDDAWSLDLADPDSPRWKPLLATGPAPRRRFAHAAVRDARRDRMLVVFGSDGTEGGFTYFDDVWALDLGAGTGLAAWSRVVTEGPGPAPRDEHVAVLDAGNDQLVVFGGFDDLTVFDDAWALDLSSSGSKRWTRLAPSGERPRGRAGAAAVYDPVGRRMLLHGGGDGVEFLDDLWSLDLSRPGEERWERVSAPGSPEGRSLHALVLDPAGPALLLAGGQALGPAGGLDRLALDGSGPPVWIAADTGPDPVPSRSSAAADFDPVSGAMILHGGLSPELRGEVHLLRRQ